MHKENKNYNKMSFLKILKIRMITNKNQKLRNSLIGLLIFAVPSFNSF